MFEDQSSHAVINRVKRIAPGACVSGKFGDFIDSTDGKRWEQARFYGHVIEAAAANKYRVAFDNNIALECFSNSLCVESASSSVPPDIPRLLHRIAVIIYLNSSLMRQHESNLRLIARNRTRMNIFHP
jgi:hypothetical protein